MFQPELAAVARLVWAVWMLLLSGLTAFGSWNPCPVVLSHMAAYSPAWAFAKCHYDGDARALSLYDEAKRTSLCCYDGTAKHTANMCGCQPVNRRLLFADCAQFLAAEGGALSKVPDFANSRLAAEHYAKHVHGIIDKGGVQTLSKYGADMPEFNSFQEYVQEARKFNSGPPPSGVLDGVRANGDILRFDTATGNFGITTPHGSIRTFFRPSEGVDYFYDQFK